MISVIICTGWPKNIFAATMSDVIFKSMCLGHPVLETHFKLYFHVLYWLVFSLNLPYHDVVYLMSLIKVMPIMPHSYLMRNDFEKTGTCRKWKPNIYKQRSLEYMGKYVWKSTFLVTFCQHFGSSGFLSMLAWTWSDIQTLERWPEICKLLLK